MLPLNHNRTRLAANHHREANSGSPALFGRQWGHSGEPVSVAVTEGADKFHPVMPDQQAVVAFEGVPRQAVAVQVAAPSMQFRAGYSTLRPLRGQPQARLATQRERDSIRGALTPGAHPSIGRSIVSPIIALGGSDL